DLSVHEMGCPYNRATEGQANSLMPKAYAQNGKMPFKVLDYFDITGVLWMTGARSQYAKVRGICFNPFNQIWSIITLNMGFQSQLLKVLADNKYKTVIGINQENFHCGISFPVMAR